ncbi:hypothetical protein pb186bvf_003772 [Paramecium bursaria]
MLQSVDQVKPDKLRHLVRPLSSKLNVRKEKKIQTYQEFLDKEYPNKMKQPPQEESLEINKNNISQIDEKDPQSEQGTIKQLNHIMDEVRIKVVDDYLEEMKQKFTEKKIEQYVKVPLNQLLGLKQEFSAEQKNQYRAMSADQRKIVVQKHESVKEQVEEKVKQKQSKEEIVKFIEGKKKDYFQIISELDLLNKGVKQLKNQTNQKHNLRQKGEEPNIEKYIKQVKDNIWYQEGITNGFEREKAKIQNLVKDVELDQSAFSVKVIIEELNKQEPAQLPQPALKPQKEQIILKKSDNSITSNITQASAREQAALPVFSQKAI